MGTRTSSLPQLSNTISWVKRSPSLTNKFTLQRRDLHQVSLAWTPPRQQEKLGTDSPTCSYEGLCKAQPRCQSTPRVEATHPDCRVFSIVECDQEVGQKICSTVSKRTDAPPSKAAYMRVVAETYRRAMETQVDVDKVERYNLEDKILTFNRHNSSGAAPGIGNIAPGQTPAPGLGRSNQLGGSDSYPDLNSCDHASQWGQDWADTSGSSDGELYGLQEGEGKGKSGSFNGICCNRGKSGHSAKFCYAKGGKAKGKGQRKEGRQQRLDGRTRVVRQ